MYKNFDEWNEKKKILETANRKYLFHEGEIWWCSVGINIGSESCGKGIDFQRPIFILKKLFGTNFIGIPISTQKKIGSWFCEVEIHTEKRYILLYQIKMFSSKRFQRRLTVLEQRDVSYIKQKLELLLGLNNHHQSN